MPVKNEEEAYEKIIDMSNNSDFPSSDLLDFGYFKKKKSTLIAIDLSKQTKLRDPQQIKFIGKLEKVMDQQCFSSSKNQKKQPLIFHKILPQSYK